MEPAGPTLVAPRRSDFRASAIHEPRSCGFGTRLLGMKATDMQDVAGRA